jgi:hypothetical protein
MVQILVAQSETQHITAEFSVINPLGDFSHPEATPRREFWHNLT